MKTPALLLAAIFCGISLSNAAPLVEFNPDSAPKQPAASVSQAGVNAELDARAKQKPANHCSYLIEPRPVAQTPRYLGVNLEIGYHHDLVNLWDWVADSGAALFRISDHNFQRPEVCTERFRKLQSRKDFDAWRTALAADPQKNLPWKEYTFDQASPWIGSADGMIAKMREVKSGAIVPIAYASYLYPVPLLKTPSEETPAPDDQINWDAAAAAYEYCLAVIHHFSRQGVSYFMLLNEPGNDEKFMQQIGVVARMARLALEDVRGKMTDKQAAAALFLGGPGHDIGVEHYFKYIHPYVDAADFHVYNPDQRTFARKYSRLEMIASQFRKKTAMSEFNRIPGPTQPDQSLFGIRASLQLADIVMTLLSSSRPDAPGFEYAMLYQFSFPATHRSYKSLLYGDTNLMDWTGTDRVTYRMSSELSNISPESMQMRHPTPAYHMFRMLARCVPAGRNSRQAYEVLATGESDRGFRAANNAALNQAVFSKLEPAKFHALGGDPDELRTLAIRTESQLFFLVLNQSPEPMKKMGIDLDLLPEKYATAVVRETSQLNRDKAMLQLPVKGKQIMLDIPAESLVQVIFTKDDLAKVTELKLEELTATPGNSKGLKMLETTRFRAMGKLDGKWIDLTDLNVVWTSSSPDLLKVYQGGLVQRVQTSGREIVVSAKTLGGVSAPPVPVPPDAPIANPGPLLANGGFEAAPAGEEALFWACRYKQDIRWELQPSPAEGWVRNTKPQVLSRSMEQNHTPGGKACMKFDFSAAQGEGVLSARSFKRNGFELPARNYKVSAWLYRPAQNGVTSGALEFRCDFGNSENNSPSNKTVPARQELKSLPANVWTKIEAAVSVPADASNMLFSIQCGGVSKPGGVLYLDDVAMEPQK